jgi:hypothetical protein
VRVLEPPCSTSRACTDPIVSWTDVGDPVRTVIRPRVAMKKALPDPVAALEAVTTWTGVRRYGAGGSVALYVDGPVKPLTNIFTLATSDLPLIRIAFVSKMNVPPCMPHPKPLPGMIAEVLVLKAPEIRSLVSGPSKGMDEDSTVALSPRGATDPLLGIDPEHAPALARMIAMLMQYRRREDPAMGYLSRNIQ